MDLRSIINTEAGESTASRQPAPVTPVQTHPPQGFREYRHFPQASPGKHPSQDYGAPPGGAAAAPPPAAPPPAPYPSPSAYHSSYQGRPPPPPPIQAPPQHDLRSPARSYSAQSPYQQTPSSTSSQYPFPQTQTHQTPQSPAQIHQYPPHLQQRDSYSQVNPQINPPPHLQHQHQHQNSFSQGSPAPQTPPIGIPGAPHPYLQQHPRSASSSTPTSAHSQQQQYFNQYPQDSPVSATHFPPSQLPQHQRQQSQQSQHSQPGTPLGPPLAQRQSSGGFAQPSSPYQQRAFPSAPYNHFQQTSPAPPPPAALPRQPSTPSAYDSQRTSYSEPQRRSQSERERSLSVSPKTRLPSQPPRAETTPQSENGFNFPTKRKMEDREVEVKREEREVRVKREDREMEQGQLVYQNDAKPQSNGDHRVPSHSPQQPPKKRIRYTEPPIWAQSVRNKPLVHRSPMKVNGKQPSAVAPSHNVPTPAVRETNGNHQPSPIVFRPGPSDTPHASHFLGPWEASITGKKPFEQMTKLVADFLYMNVVDREDIGELSSRGIEVEIEAKLGQIIDKETNERLRLPVMSECLLQDNQRTAFRSSMTENQHQKLNDFLNARVKETHPGNVENRGKRVQIQYLHRREVDKFFELPPALQANLPPVIRSKLNPRHAVKVRVSYDQKTDAVLAKIIKVRLVDLNIFNPAYPLDCRISINFEMKWDGDLEDLVVSSTSPDRIKDRLSYSQSHYQIDLTQVTQMATVNGVKRMEKEHELEIEISAAAVRDQGQRAARNEPNEYVLLVEGMIDNVRVLQRNVPPQ